MTHQELNYIYYKFTNNKKGIKFRDNIIMNGYELKEFLEFGIKLANENRMGQLEIDEFHREAYNQ